MEKGLIDDFLKSMMETGCTEVEVFCERREKVVIEKKRRQGQAERAVFFDQGVGVTYRLQGERQFRFFPGEPEQILSGLRHGEDVWIRQGMTLGKQDPLLIPASYKLALQRLYEEIEGNKKEQLQGTSLPDLSTGTKVMASLQQVAIGNSGGVYETDLRSYVSIDLWGEYRVSDRPIIAQAQAGGGNIGEIRAQQEQEQVVKRLCQRIEGMQGAIRVPTGEWTVVFAPGNPGILFHEACGHGLEGDLARHPQAVYGDKMNEQVASEQVHLVDNPLEESTQGYYQVDDEGTPAEKTVMIEKGKVKNYLCDQRVGKYWGKGSNGHGRRVSYRYPSIPRMSNTFVMNGEYQADEIIHQTEKGLYVSNLGVAETNLTTGQFKIRLHEGALIENGRLTTPLTNGWIFGSGLEILQSVDRVGQDFHIYHSGLVACNKFNQHHLPISVGSPTLRLQKIQVRGGDQ